MAHAHKPPPPGRAVRGGRGAGEFILEGRSVPAREFSELKAGALRVLLPPLPLGGARREAEVSVARRPGNSAAGQLRLARPRAGSVSCSGAARARAARPGPNGHRRPPAAMRHLPYFCRGEVVKGFGRGSKELGIPTANFSEQVVESFPPDISTGIYYGWACVGNGDVHKMVLSIGWNPFYKNIKKSVETHIIHTFKEDFYGEMLSIVITGYIRPEKNFDSLEALISAIQEDIEEAKRQLDLPEHLKLKEDNFFHLPEGKIVNNH
ncbi:riboflavin kinase [Apteryx rowi]|nr:riboflavin kinase [Apteryx rowi]